MARPNPCSARRRVIKLGAIFALQSRSPSPRSPRSASVQARSPAPRDHPGRLALWVLEDLQHVARRPKAVGRKSRFERRRSGAPQTGPDDLKPHRAPLSPHSRSRLRRGLQSPSHRHTSAAKSLQADELLTLSGPVTWPYLPPLCVAAAMAERRGGVRYRNARTACRNASSRSWWTQWPAPSNSATRASLK
jgi:hypothetical protein